MTTITKKAANKELQDIKNAIIKAREELFEANMDILKATEKLLEVREAQLAANNTLINVNHEIIFKSASSIINHALKCVTPKEEYHLN
jgi:hypothetical protein